ncbi:hypothetical protein EQZ20_24565 (plasmid) [Bacillus glycinifermentans]|uniref:Uncharacterized protein n=1 Tax=Bacillus glycinifermentans TaxID=1664069 RepID=A0AAJ3Z3G6_9BACI|nr:hypothetical protein [Bacillus glycinifermentans]QAT68050.1 hypothetical protein EQZ20_24565 [Bacillus glycinifermentans]
MKNKLREEANYDEKTELLHKRQKKIFYLIVSIFIACLSLYIFSFFAEEKKASNRDDDSSLIAPTNDKNKVTHKPAIKEDKVQDADKAEMQRVLSSFVKNYFEYDQENTQKHLEESKKYLTPEFYKELNMSEENSMKAPSFAYRVVKDISYSSYETVNETPHWTLNVDADLLDEHKKKYSSIKVEFAIDLEKRKDDWKVAYFAVTGKGIQENE